MKPVNIYLLTALNDPIFFEKYEKQLSFRTEKLKLDWDEIQSIKQFVQNLKKEKCKSDDLEGYFYAFKIPQIGKEFDLLRISRESVINIEFKSQTVTEETISAQLIKNKYYLRSLDKALKQYTYVHDIDTLYYMDENENLHLSNFSDLIKDLVQQTDIFHGNIDTLFKVSNYLISPLNTPERFLAGEYFLNNNQDEIKKNIKTSIDKNKDLSFYGLTGGPGTGKTLLLYDLAVELCKSGKCLMIHCGILSNGHRKLNDIIENLTIIPAKDIKEDYDFLQYQYILIDESHRLYWPQFEIIKNTVNRNLNLRAIFSYDRDQILSSYEAKSDIAGRIEALGEISIHKLSKKIRTNPEISSFIKRFMDLKSHDIMDSYPSVDISFAEQEDQVRELISYYQLQGYTFIRYSGSNYYKSQYDDISFLTTQEYDTHHIIGQEFDKVVMVIGNNFVYNEDKKLTSYQHPNPDYLYRNLLFQGMTRTRERLAVVIWDNRDVFEAVLSIVQRDKLKKQSE